MMHATLVHDALIYDSDEEFVEALTPFAIEGLEQGEEVVVVSRPGNCELLRHALGARADDARYIDSSAWYRSPVRTIAAYHDVIEQTLVNGSPGLRVIGEVEFGDSDLEHAEWTRYEAALNIAFESDPAWIVCPYDARRLPASVVADAACTHPHARFRGTRAASPSFVQPHKFVAPLPVPAPARLLGEVELNGALKPVRQLVTQTAGLAGIDPERVADLCVVVTEIATNAMVHGEMPIVVRSWGDNESVVYEVTDAGPGPSDPLIGFIPPARHQKRGRGLWISRQLADRIEITTGASGASVRVAAFRDTPRR